MTTPTAHAAMPSLKGAGVRMGAGVSSAACTDSTSVEQRLDGGHP